MTTLGSGGAAVLMASGGCDEVNEAEEGDGDCCIAADDVVKEGCCDV